MTNAGPIVQLLLDSSLEQASLQQLLSVDSTWQVLEVQRAIDAVTPTVHSAQPDVILLDASIYQSRWPQIQDVWPTSTCSVVVLLDHDDEALAAAVLAAGAQDYLVKSHLNGTRLRHTVYTLWQQRQLERSKRQQTEADLRNQRNLLRAFLDNLPHIAWLKDPSGRFITTNAAFGDSCGVPPEELAGKTDYDIWPSELARAYRDDDAAVMVSGRQKRVEERLAAADGSERWIDTIKTPVYDDDGEILGTVGIAIDVTDRKCLEEELRASQAQLQDILQSSNACIASFRLFPDLRWEYDYYSPGCELIYGYPPEVMRTDQQLWRSLVLPEDFETVIVPAIQEMLQGQGTGVVEFRCRHRDGSIRWVSETCTAHWDQGQGCWRVTTVGVDISDRKQTEVALRQIEADLRQQETQLRLSLEFARIGAWCWWPDTGVYTWYGAMESLLEIPAGLQNMFEIWCERIHPSDRDVTTQIIEQGLASRTAFEAEYRYQLSNGQWVWRYLKGQGQYLPSGVLDRALGVVIDVDQRKRNEEALQESEARFKAIFDQAGVGICQAAMNGQIMSANQQFCDFLGYREAELQQITYADYSHPDDMRTDAALMQRLVAGEIAYFTMEKRFLHRSGEVRWGSLTVSLIRGADGQPLADIAVVHDIGDKIRLEAERQQVEASLRQSEARLLEAQRLAHVGNWEYDLITGKLTWSQELLRMYGFDESIQGPTFEEFTACIHPEDAPDLNQAIQNLVTDGTPYGLYHRIIRPDGMVRYTFCKGQALLDDQGQVVKTFGISQDITDTKATEIALRASERKHRALVSALPDLIIRMSGDGLYLDFFAASTMTMVDGPELVGSHIYDRGLPRELAERRMGYIRQALETGELQVYEQEIFNGDSMATEEVRIVPSGYNEVIIIVRDISDEAESEAKRQQAEAALRDSERRYSTLTEMAPVGIFRFDAEGQCVYVNSRWCEMTGQLPEAASGETWAELLHPEDRDRLLTGWLEAFAQQRPYRNEGRHIHINGRVVWFDLQMVPEFDDSGDLLGYIGTISDITDRKQTEAAMQEASQRLALATDAASLGIWDWNILENRLLWDERMYELYGLQPSESGEVFETWRQRVHPEDIVPVEAQVQSAIAGDQDFHTDFRVVLPDGQIRFVEAHAIISRDPTGTAYRMIGVNWDISDRKQAELDLQQLNEELEDRIQQRTKELARSEQDLRTVFNNVYDAIFIHDVDGKVLDVNDRALELTGATRGQLVNASVADLSAVDAPSEQISENIRRVKAGETLRFEWKNRRFDDCTSFDTEMSLRQVRLGNRTVLLAGMRDISDRKAAERAIQASERRYATLAEVAPVAIFRFDEPLNCTYVSDRWSALTGRPTASAMGRGWIEALHPDDRDQLLAIWSKCYDQATPGELLFEGNEGRHLRPDGSVNWFYVQVAPELNSEGEIVGYIGTLTDITERKQIEAELAESEAKFRRLVEGAKDVIWSYDADANFTYISPQFQTLFGWDPVEWVGKSAADLIHPDDLPELLSEYWNRFSENTLSESYSQYPEFRHLHRNGHYVWVRISGAPILNAEGDFIGVQGILTDISDRKQAERDLQESRNMLELVLNAIPQRVFWKDRGSKFLGCNPAFANDYQLSQEDIIGKTDSELPWAAWADLYRVDDEQVMTTGIPRLNYEEPTTNLQGEHIWIRTSKIPLTNSQGEVIGILGCYDDITDRKKAEEALRDSEERLRLALMASNQGLYDLDLQTGNAIVSPTYVTMLGYNPANFRETNAKWLQRLHPDDYERVLSVFRAYVAGEIADYKVEFRQRMQNGRWKWLLSVGKIVAWDENGNPLRLLGTHTDIDERRQAEEALQQSEEKFRQIAENISEVFWLATPDNEILYASPAFERIWGCPADSFEVGTWLETVHPDDRERLLSTTGSMIHQQSNEWPQQSIEMEYRIIRPDDEIRWIRDRAFPVYDEQGHFHRIAGVAEDITERKRLQQEQQRLLLLLEASPDHIGMAYPDGTLIWTNQQAKQLRGLPPDSDLTQLSLDIFHPQWAQAVLQQEAIPKALEGDVWIGETALLTADEREIPVSQLVWANRSETGEVEYMSTIMRDISDLKRAEQALREANAELEHRVEERTAELVDARDAAEAANRAKSTFLANMSHELRTPLNAILGFSQLLGRDRQLSAPQLEKLEIINRSGEHLLTLINDILEMSKIESGQITLNSETFNLPQLLDSLMEMLQFKADGKGLGFTIHRQPQLPNCIRADSHKLRQVLINLLGNALKFTQAGFVELRVGLGSSQAPPVPGDGDSSPLSLRFEVQDTGCGIAPEEFELLFEPFIQTASGRLSQEGTGLGLPISRQFIQMMGGELWLDSEVGVGSTFIFEIPVEAVDATTLEMPEPERRAIALAPDQREYRILIVEDNWANGMLLQNLLTELGFVVQTATQGEEAVELWQHWQPDLILMDLRMPVMDGYEATRQIRAREWQQRQGDMAVADREPPTAEALAAMATAPESGFTKIIALTADVFEEKRAKVRAVGCHDFIGKPVREAAIAQLLAKHLSVQYVYESEGSTAAIARRGQTLSALTVETLRALPVEWILQFYEGIIHLNQERMLGLIEELSAEHDEVAQILRKRVQDFEYESLLELAQEILQF